MKYRDLTLECVKRIAMYCRCVVLNGVKKVIRHRRRLASRSASLLPSSCAEKCNPILCRVAPSRVTECAQLLVYSYLEPCPQKCTATTAMSLREGRPLSPRNQSSSPSRRIKCIVIAVISCREEHRTGQHSQKQKLLLVVIAMDTVVTVHRQVILLGGDAVVSGGMVGCSLMDVLLLRSYVSMYLV